MSALFQFFLFLLTLNNLALLGMGRLRTLINLVTAQGILLGGLPNCLCACTGAAGTLFEVYHSDIPHHIIQG